MTKMTVALLIGPALDWAVAKALGHVEDCCSWLYESTVEEVADSTSWRPSTDWATGGPLIEKHGISVVYEPSMLYGDDARWKACEEGVEPTYGPTPLVAAMRRLVERVLGVEIEVPIVEPPSADQAQG